MCYTISNVDFESSFSDSFGDFEDPTKVCVILMWSKYRQKRSYLEYYSSKGVEISDHSQPFLVNDIRSIAVQESGSDTGTEDLKDVVKHRLVAGSCLEYQSHRQNFAI